MSIATDQINVTAFYTISFIEAVTIYCYSPVHKLSASMHCVDTYAEEMQELMLKQEE